MGRDIAATRLIEGAGGVRDGSRLPDVHRIASLAHAHKEYPISKDIVPAPMVHLNIGRQMTPRHRIGPSAYAPARDLDAINASARQVTSKIESTSGITKKYFHVT